jgi:hypothetical protein
VAPARLRIIFSAAFALALIAGAAAGVLATRFASQSTVVPGVTTLDDLQLSSDQRDRIKQIWENVRDQSEDLYKRAEALQREHDDKVFKLLTPEQQKQYKQIYDQDRDTYARLMAERQATVKKAVNDTKNLLSDTQRQKYDVILKNRLGKSAEPGTVWFSAPAASQPANPVNSLQDLQSQVRR